MSEIVVLYSPRDNTADIAARIAENLTSQFGRRAVFDVGVDIPTGVNQIAAVQQAAAYAEVVLVVMGSLFTESVSNPDDLVRVGVQTALERRDVHVLPVLTMGAKMPPLARFPTGMRAIANHVPARVRMEPDFRQDMQMLTRDIQHLIDVQTLTRKQKSLLGRVSLWFQGMPPMQRVLTTAASVLFAVLTLLFAYIEVLPEEDRIRLLTNAGLLTPSAVDIPTNAVVIPATVQIIVTATPDGPPPPVYIRRSVDTVAVCADERALIAELTLFFEGQNLEYHIGETFGVSGVSSAGTCYCFQQEDAQFPVPPGCTNDNTYIQAANRVDYRNADIIVRINEREIATCKADPANRGIYECGFDPSS